MALLKLALGKLSERIIQSSQRIYIDRFAPIPTCSPRVEQPASVISNRRKSMQMISLQFRYRALERYFPSIIAPIKSSIGFSKWLG